MDKAAKEFLAMIGIVFSILASIIFITWAIWDSVG